MLLACFVTQQHYFIGIFAVTAPPTCILSEDILADICRSRSALSSWWRISCGCDAEPTIGTPVRPPTDLCGDICEKMLTPCGNICGRLCRGGAICIRRDDWWDGPTTELGKSDDWPRTGECICCDVIPPGGAITCWYGFEYCCWGIAARGMLPWGDDCMGFPCGDSFIVFGRPWSKSQEGGGPPKLAIGPDDGGNRMAWGGHWIGAFWPMKAVWLGGITGGGGNCDDGGAKLPPDGGRGRPKRFWLVAASCCCCCCCISIWDGKFWTGSAPMLSIAACNWGGREPFCSDGICWCWGEDDIAKGWVWSGCCPRCCCCCCCRCCCCCCCMVFCSCFGNGALNGDVFSHILAPFSCDSGSSPGRPPEGGAISGGVGNALDTWTALSSAVAVAITPASSVVGLAVCW